MCRTTAENGLAWARVFFKRPYDACRAVAQFRMQVRSCVLFFFTRVLFVVAHGSCNVTPTLLRPYRLFFAGRAHGASYERTGRQPQRNRRAGWHVLGSANALRAAGARWKAARLQGEACGMLPSQVFHSVVAIAWESWDEGTWP